MVSGSTGDLPVPSGDSPNGRAATVPANKDGLFAKVLAVVPVGGAPAGGVIHRRRGRGSRCARLADRE